MTHSRLRIAIGGIRHETNTFSPVWTNYNDFRMTRGLAVLENGLEQIAEDDTVELRPAFVASAMPSGLVRRAAYDRLKRELLSELQAMLPLDGVYLDLHGAMEVQDLGDGESDLIPAVRGLVGRDVLISVSLDLHGNISSVLVDHANILTALRTAPHRDGPQTRRRALALLLRALREGLQPVSVLIKPPLLLAGESAVTEREPARSLYASLQEIERAPGILDASILVGCAWTDSPHTSASVIVVGERDSDLAQGKAAGLAGEVWSRRHDFSLGVEAASVDEAILSAMGAAERTVYLSDSGDNVTAGGAGDIPLIASRLLALGARDALVAGLSDPEAVRQCAAAGVGAELELTIGGKLHPVHGSPLAVTARVEHLSSKQAGAEQPESATVRVGDIHVILSADRRAFADRASMATAGVDPEYQKIVVVKLGYLFPDLYDHAPRSIMVLSPGATDLRLERLPYHRLARPVFPLDAGLSWEPV